MRGRRVAYAIMMGTCLTLFVPAWAVVRHFSVPAAIGMSVAAMVIPPFAAVVANGNIDREGEDVHREHDGERRDGERREHDRRGGERRDGT